MATEHMKRWCSTGQQVCNHQPGTGNGKHFRNMRKGVWEQVARNRSGRSFPGGQPLSAQRLNNQHTDAQALDCEDAIYCEQS